MHSNESINLIPFYEEKKNENILQSLKLIYDEKNLVYLE